MYSNNHFAHQKQSTSIKSSRPRLAFLLALAPACIVAAPLLTSIPWASPSMTTMPTALQAQTPPAKKDPAGKKVDPRNKQAGKENGDAKNKKDAPAQPPAAKTPKRESVWALIKKGGWTMVGLFLMSTIIVAFAAERFFFFRAQKVNVGKEYFAELESSLEKGGTEELRKQLKDDDRLVSRILTAGLAYESEGGARVEKAIENSASVEVGNLERGLNLLSNLGNLAPLLGFFGTVVGMRVSFLQFVEKAAPTARDLAGGVEEALITTAAGLLIAIPTYLAYNLFIYRIDSFNIELERCAAAILARFKA